MCSERRDPYSVKQRLNLPLCRSGTACKSDCAVRWRAFSLQPAKTAAIVLLYGFDERHTRSTDNNPLREYLRDMMLMLRLVLSLRRVGTTLPIHLYMAGQRYAKYESPFRELGVQVSGAQYIARPRWGHPWHGGSFAKLFALALANFSKVLVLDSDCVVFRNIDHMGVFPTPSFRFQTVRVGTECKWELQSGVMVLEPDSLEYDRAIRLTTSLKSRPPGSDGGDQSVWRIFYERVHELPAAYNAFKYELNGSENWASVFVLHDGWNMRWSRWWPDAYPAHGRLLADLTANASDLMIRAANFSLATPRSMRACYHQELSRRPTRVVYICDWKNLTPSRSSFALSDRSVLSDRGTWTPSALGGP